MDRALALKNLPEGGKFEYTDVDGKTSVVQVKGMREALERAKDMIEDGVADTRLLDAAENQAERVLRGQDLGQVTRMGREQVDAGRQVVRNVPGKEASTEIGRRGQKFVTTGKLEAAEQEKARSVCSCRSQRSFAGVGRSYCAQRTPSPRKSGTEVFVPRGRRRPWLHPSNTKEFCQLATH